METALLSWKLGGLKQAAEKASFGEVAATSRRHKANNCNAQMAG